MHKLLQNEYVPEKDLIFATVLFNTNIGNRQIKEKKLAEFSPK